MKSKYYMIIAMIVLAVFAIGAVSASENITADIDEPTDDVDVDDVAVEEIDEQADDVAVDDVAVKEADEGGNRAITYNPFPVYSNSNFTDINNKISNGTYTGYEFIFVNSTYTNFSMVTGNNNKFTGNGASISGPGDLFTAYGSNNIIITGFNMYVSSGNAGIYGANVTNAEISYNNITGGKDGINIKETYDNLTITGNKITNFTRDGISLVDHRTFADLSSKGNSIISNNVITGISIASSEVGMFFGGNFKGTISGNVITKVKEGVEFTGKKAKTNGRLNATFHNNNICDIQIGIYMNNHNVDFFNITNCNIGLNSSNIRFAIQATSNFVATGYIGVYNSNFNGTITQSFKDAAGNNTGNNTGF